MKTPHRPASAAVPSIRQFLEELSVSLEEAPETRPDIREKGEGRAAAPLGASVLIAEDDEDDYDFLRELLLAQRADLNITRFTNGADLTDHLMKTDTPLPALLILDLNMPFKDGREALGEIKAVRRFVDLPVFVLTTSASTADETFVSSFPAVTFATKPVRYQEYVALVKKLLHRVFPGAPEGER